MTTPDAAMVRDEQERRAQAQRVLYQAYALVFSTVEGQQVLADLRRSAFYERTTVERDALRRVDVEATLRNEGARAFVLGVEANIRKGQGPPVEPPPVAVGVSAADEEA